MRFVRFVGSLSAFVPLTNFIYEEQPAQTTRRSQNAEQHREDGWLERKATLHFTYKIYQNK